MPRSCFPLCLLLSTLMAMAVPSSAFADTEEAGPLARHSISVDLTLGLLAAYEYRFTRDFALRGAGGLTLFPMGNAFNTGHLDMTWFSLANDSGDKMLELGAGLALFYHRDHDTKRDLYDLALSALAGYRYQKPDGGVVIRIGVRLYNFSGEGSLYYPYLTLGYAF